MHIVLGLSVHAANYLVLDRSVALLSFEAIYWAIISRDVKDFSKDWMTLKYYKLHLLFFLQSASDTGVILACCKMLGEF